MKLKRKILNIFAALVMVIGSVPMAFSSVHAEEPAGEAPKSLKTLKTNNDGTYDITLEVEGVSSNKSDATKANVVVVFDTSGSMNDAATFKVNTTGRYGLVNNQYVNLYHRVGNGFNQRCELIENDTTSGTTYVNANCSNTYNGTARYEAASNRMDVAKAAVNGLATKLLSQNDPTNEDFKDVVEMAYIGFATSVNTTKNPTTDLDTFKGWVNNTAISTGNEAGTNWEAALKAANDVTFNDNDKTYIIFVSDGNPTFRDSQYDSEATDCVSGYSWYGRFYCADETIWGSGHDDPSPYRNFNAAKDVADIIVANPNKELFAVGAFGDADNMVNLGGTYKDASNQAALEAAFDDIVDKITMGLSVADLQISDGITSATSMPVKGTVGAFRYSTPWGNNEAGVDFAKATFENGTVHWNPGHNKTLSNGEKASVTFTVWPSQEAMDCIANIRNGNGCSISDDKLAEYGLGKNSDGSFKLLTNTEASFTYRTVTTIEGTDEQSFSSVSQPVTIPEKRDDTTLPETTLDVRKKWLDGLDSDQRGDIRDVAVDLYVDKATNPDPVRHYTFSNKDENGNEWIGRDENGKTAFTVAPGVMKLLDGTPATEGLEEIAKRIVTVDGNRYAVLEEGHDYEFSDERYTFNEGKESDHYYITKYTYHPMIVNDGKIHNVVFTKDAETGAETAVIEPAVLTKLTLENTLKGGILVSKVVINNGEVDNSIEEKYPIRIYNISAPKGFYRVNTYEADGVTLTADGKGEKKEYINGEIKENITVNQKIIVTDVPTGTTFEVDEQLPAGYTKRDIAYEVIQHSETGVTTLPGVNKVYGNASSTATVTNHLTSGELKISKTVTADKEQYLAKAQEKEFNFTVNIYKKQGEKTPIITKSFSLKHGDTPYSIKNIPVGFYYEVIEEAKAGFTAVGGTTKTGTISQGENKADFTNNYSVSPLDGDDAKIIANKKFVEGREQFWKDDEFVFLMYGNGETAESEPIKKIGNSGSTEFTVNITDAGTYTYRITEKETDENNNSLFRPGVSRLEGDEDIVVTIVVEDNEDGTLRLVSKTYSKASKTIFNTYEATNTWGEGETEGALKFDKVLEGRDWEDFDAFTFTISSQDENAPMPKTTSVTVTKDDVENGKASFDFGKIKYVTDDVDKSYSYLITETFDTDVMKSVEQSSDTANGIAITVIVTDNEDGTLNLQVSEYNHTFTNIYTPDNVTTDDSELTKTLFDLVKVVVDEQERFDGEEFVFTVESDDFETRTLKVETATTGVAEMDEPYVFEEPGTYTFTVKETAGNNSEVVYDDTVYTVEIEVVDNPEEGKLEIKNVKVNGKNSSKDTKLTFTNQYKPEMYNETGELTVKKIWEGGLNFQNTVTVRLTAAVEGEELWHKEETISKLGSDWTVTFTGLYKYEHGKEITYTIEEVGILGAEEASFIVYGSEMTEDGKKSVEGKWISSKDGFDLINTWEEATNVYGGKDEFYIEKVNENGKPLADVTFTIAGKDYKTNSKGLITVRVPEAIDVKTDKLSFTISEKATLEGYDLVEGSATIKVTSESILKDVDEEELVNTYEKEYSYEKSGKEEFVWNNEKKTLVVTNNRSTAKSLTIRKEIAGIQAAVLREKGLEFTVSGPDDFSEQTVDFSEFTKVSEGVYEYQVAGKLPTGKYTVEESDASFEGLLGLTVSGDNGVVKQLDSEAEVTFTIKNSYEKIRDVAFKVSKVWDDADDKDGIRPEELVVTLTRSGEDYKTAVLNEENGWTYEWVELPRAGEDAVAYEYSATEEEVEGYESDGGEMVDGELVFTNTHTPEPEPEPEPEPVDPCELGGCGKADIPVITPDTGKLVKSDTAGANSSSVNYIIGIAAFIVLGFPVMLLGKRKEKADRLTK